MVLVSWSQSVAAAFAQCICVLALEYVDFNYKRYRGADAVMALIYTLYNLVLSLGLCSQTPCKDLERDAT